MELYKKYQKNKFLSSEKVEGVGILLYDDEKQETHLLNENAALIWELIDGEKTADAIFLLYKSRIDCEDIAVDEIEEDYYEVIGQLQERGIILETI